MTRKKPTSAPYISFVIWSRNDDYVEDLLSRFQASLDVLMEQLERRRIASEIVIVEWNPPPERLPLRQALQFPQASDAVTVRVITVGADYHHRYRYADKRPIHCSVAMNVGIRRARGRFLLPRAQDVFYSEAVATFLAEQTLSDGDVYRCDRHDVAPEVLNQLSLGTAIFLESCGRNIVRYHDSEWNAHLPGVPRLHVGSPGDFLLMARQYWFAIRGFHETPDVCSLDDDVFALHAAHGAGAREVVLPDACRIYKIAHHSITRERVEPIYSPILEHLRDAARVVLNKGIRHHFCRIFNVPRRRVKNLDGVLFDSFERSFLPVAQRWARGIGPFYLNDENWGLADADLPETVLCKADWDR